MTWLRSRAARIRRFGRVVVALVLLSVSLATAVAYWSSLLGYPGLVVVAGLIVVALLAVMVMPESAWDRLTAVDTAADDLGRLHEEGVALRAELPWVRDEETEQLDAYKERVEDWATRTHDQMAARWRGVFLSDVVGFRTSTGGYALASRYRNYLDDRLERLSQIMISIGGPQR